MVRINAVSSVGQRSWQRCALASQSPGPRGEREPQYNGLMHPHGKFSSFLWRARASCGMAGRIPGVLPGPTSRTSLASLGSREQTKRGVFLRLGKTDAPRCIRFLSLGRTTHPRVVFEYVSGKPNKKAFEYRDTGERSEQSFLSFFFL